MTKKITHSLSVTTGILVIVVGLFAPFIAKAVLVERLPPGMHNIKAPVVNETLAAYTRNIDMTAPRADTSPKHRIYTYDNSVSEYLRDNLNLPKMDSNYAMQSASYLKTERQRNEHNSTVQSIAKDSNPKNKKVVNKTTAGNEAVEQGKKNYPRTSFEILEQNIYKF